jgi:hypothetical protein
MSTFNKYLLNLDDLSGNRSTEIIRNLSSSQILSEFKAIPEIDQTKLIGTDKNEYLRSIKSDDYTKIIGLTEKTEAGFNNITKVITTLQELGEKFKERNKVDIIGPNPGLFGTNNLAYAKIEEDEDIGKIILDEVQGSGVDLSELKKLKDGAVKLSLASSTTYPYIDLSSHAIGSPIDLALFMNTFILTKDSTSTRTIKNKPEAKFIINLLDAYKIDFDEFAAEVPVINNVDINKDKIKFEKNILKDSGTPPRKISLDISSGSTNNLFTKEFKLDKLKEFYDDRYNIEEGVEFADIQLMATYYLCFNKFYNEISKIINAISKLVKENERVKEIIKESFKKSLKSLKKYIDGCFNVYYNIDGGLNSYKDEYGLPFKISKDKIEYVKEEKIDKISYSKVKFSDRNNLLIVEDIFKNGKTKTFKNLINFFTILNYRNCIDPISNEKIYLGGLIQKTEYISNISDILYKYFNLIFDSKKEILKMIEFKEKLLSNSLLAKDLIIIRDKIEKAIREIDIKTTSTEKTLECQKQINQLISFFINFTEKELSSKNKLETRILSNKLIKDIDIIEEKEKEKDNDTDSALNYLKQQNKLKQEAMILMIPKIFEYMDKENFRIKNKKLDLGYGCNFKEKLINELRKKRNELQIIHKKDLEPKLLAIQKESKASNIKYQNALRETHSTISSLTPSGIGISNSTIIRLKPEGKREIGKRVFWERVLSLLGRTIYLVVFNDDMDPKNGEQYHSYFDLINAAILADKPNEVLKKCFINVLRGRIEFIRDIGSRGSIIVCNRKDNLGDSKEWIQVPLEYIYNNIEKSSKYSNPIFIRYMIYNILASNNYFQRISINKWGNSKESFAKRVLLKVCYDQAKASDFSLSECIYITCREQVAYALSSNINAISTNYNLDFSSGQSQAVIDPAHTKIIDKQILLKQYGGIKEKNIKKKNKK